MQGGAAEVAGAESCAGGGGEGVTGKGKKRAAPDEQMGLL